ncbi:hypothetical protein acdb102_13580 [Acidothermaceae bacterium B102]|nr:hypothetical protein acdb102_13580 [Acidothermaceae bacterium B102]
MTRLVAVLVSLALLTAGCQTGARPAATGTIRSTAVPGSADPVLAPGPLYSKAAATARANAVLALASLPGATRVTHVGATTLNGPPESTDDPQQVDVHSLWTAPGDKRTYLARLLQHPPVGFGKAGEGGYAGTPTGPVWVTFTRGVGQVGEIYVTAADDGDHIDLRVDVSDSWVTQRPADTLVPVSVTSAVLDYDNGFTNANNAQLGPGQQDTTPKPAHAHVVLAGTRLATVVHELNTLIPQSGGTRSCPMDSGESFILTFAYGGHRTVFDVDVLGCGDVLATPDRRPPVDLAGDQRLTDDLFLAIGVVKTPIPSVPAQGPPVRTPAPAIAVLQHNAVQAMRVARDFPNQVGPPHDFSYQWNAGVVPRPPYTGLGAAVNWTEAYTVKGTVDQLVAWFRAYPAKGTVAAEPLPEKDGVRRLVMEPIDHSKPVSVLVWVSMLEKGDMVVLRVDSQAAWKH